MVGTNTKFSTDNFEAGKVSGLGQEFGKGGKDGKNSLPSDLGRARGWI